MSKDPGIALEVWQEAGVLRVKFPCLQALVGFGGGDTGHKSLWDHTKRVVAQTLPRPLLRWAALFHDVGKPRRFKREGGVISFHHHEAESARLFRKAARDSGFFTTQEVEEIAFVIENLGHIEAYSPEWTDSAVRRLSKLLGDRIDSVFAVARADCTTKHSHKRRRQMRVTHELRARIARLQESDSIAPALPKGLGGAIMQYLKLPPGKALGEIMKSLEARVESGELPRNATYDVYLEALKS